MVEREGRGGSLEPERELVTPDGYRWFTFSAEDTGLRLVCLEDIGIGVILATALANPEKRTAAHKAWAGARQSRAPGTPWEIMNEMGEKGIDPDKKLEETFVGYGHASVGDMARLQVDFVNIPMHLAFSLFNNASINSGQEKSTRYQQRFRSAVLHPISNCLPEGLPNGDLEVVEGGYQALGELSLSLFAKHRELLAAVFTDFYKPENVGQRNALASRVLDCARSFLLLGQLTGMSFEDSARDFSRIIGEMKASPIYLYNKVAFQLERLLAPSLEEEGFLGFRAESPSLIRHTEENPIVNQNLLELQKFIAHNTNLLEFVGTNCNFATPVEQSVELLAREFTEGEKMVAQYLLTLWPSLDRAQLLSWVCNQDTETKEKISEIIMAGHNNYKELPLMAATRGMSVVFTTSLGEARDFNRHRAWGRFISLPLTYGMPLDWDRGTDILFQGFTLPLYLTEVEEFSSLREEFEKDLLDYYLKVEQFVRAMKKQFGDFIDYSFVLNLLPLAHQIDLWMHGDPKQALYFTDRRTRPGGHINYRVLAWEANQLIADSDPYLSAMRLDNEPNPASRDEFFDRS